MSFTASIEPSPVAAAFGRIEHDPVPLVKLRRVLDSEKETLRAAESNPLDYTLADRAEATAYVRLLLKVLNETAGIGPSPRVSHVKERLSDDEAIELLHTDSTGVLTHYAIAKLNEIVVCLKERTSKSGVSVATTFYNDSGVLIDDYRPLVRILHLGGTGDAYSQRGAALILAQVLIKGCPSQQKRTASVALKCSSVQEPLQALVSWIASQLQSSSRTCLNLVMPSLMTLMTCPEARTMFENGGGIGYLTKHLRRRPNGVNNKHSKNNTGASVQQLYELCFCLWTLTYDLNSSGAVRTHFARDGTVGALVDLVAEAPREKVVRVAIFALCYLATCIAIDNETNGKRVVNAKFFLTEMIGCGLFKSIERMKERQWTDPDIVEDLNLLYKLLQSTYNEMSRFDVYSAEIESGHLEWGIVHSEKFFREHAKRLEGKDGDFELLRALIMLAAGDDEDVASIACYDIGEFVRNYPNGRSIAKRLGAKEVVMQLIENDNEELKRQALLCVSKMMVQNWSAIR